MNFKTRWAEFVKNWLTSAGITYSYTLAEVIKKGVPPTHHYHNGSLESRGLGRLDWQMIASDYWAAHQTKRPPQ